MRAASPGGGPGERGALAGLPRLRPWERLSVRLALFFSAVTLLAVAAVGLLTYARQQREIEDAVGTQILNIARLAALQVEPGLLAELGGSAAPGTTPAATRLRRTLGAIQDEALLTAPMTILADYDPARRRARILLASSGRDRSGEAVAVPEALLDPIAWTLQDGVARYSRVYAHEGGLWISALAALPAGRPGARMLLQVGYPVEIYLDRLQEFRNTLLFASAVGALATLGVGLLVVHRLTRPIAALTAGVGRVARGDLSDPLPVRGGDEVGRLTRAFNAMLDGLRQRDFIRSAFGRYVSPEVARTLLESPEGLRFGGAKRTVTVLMSDLRGYTRFAEQGDPEQVMEVLNGYLARMADVIIAHGGTINEFLGDGIFAVYGAPVTHADHARRAAATAVAMQQALVEVNAEHERRGLPRFEMGIGIHTGEAVAGNIGSEQRAKYAVVGTAVNVASRVESATVGGQILVTAATRAEIGDAAVVGPPMAISVKGLSDPLTVCELRGLGGAGGLMVPGDPPGAERQVEVSLPFLYRIVDGKIVRDESAPGVVVRLGRRELRATVTTPLDPLTNVVLRVAYPDGGGESEPIYAKVLEREGVSGLLRMRITALGVRDEQALAALLAGRAPSA